MKNSLRLSIVILFCFLISEPAFSSSLMIEGAFARASSGHGKNSAAYLSIHNHSPNDDYLIEAKTNVAAMTSIHNHINDKGIMKMRAVQQIAIPANDNIKLQPGGFHIMLMGLKKPLLEGDKFDLTLVFKKAGNVPCTVRVKKVHAMRHGKKKKHTH
ncbi:copper chaperone PCu(A)C [Alphaproteobacteria bacterium]|nr:copper chaperone PCu(A)C [Alphaproteobacteria bacterium]